jgi:hypothetical protein
MNETREHEDSDERLAWIRPTLRRMNANRADHGIVGGGDTPGNDMMS